MKNTKKKKTKMACLDCRQQREVDAKERYNRGRINCFGCGGTLVRIKELPPTEDFPIHESNDELKRRNQAR